MRRHCLFAVFVLALVVPASIHAQAGASDTVAGRFDTGKMWTFEYAPAEYFTETYGFDASPAWFERGRMAALRIPGCSASFVSPNGLLATNHHCVRGRVSQVSRPGEALLDNGFQARTLEEERPIPGYYADQLVAVQDVSDVVFAASDGAGSDAERAQAQQRAFGQVEQELLARYASTGDSIWVQFVALYHGGRHSAYVFRRFTDVRLVAAAELQMGFFGGDPDNFTYPRYALDFAFLRVYGRDGQPYQTEHYFGWGSDGVATGDVVFVIGNPGPTNRLKTIAQLEYQRDVELPATLHAFQMRLDAMDDYRHAFPDEAEGIDIRNRMFGLSNSLKATIGRLDALGLPLVMGRRRDAESTLRQAIRQNPELQQRFGDVFSGIASLQDGKRRHAAPYGAFRLLGSANYSSATVRRALAAARYFAARTQGQPEDDIAGAREELTRIEDLPRDLERRFLILELRDFARYFGPDHEITRAALGSRTAPDAAGWMLEHSALGSARATAEAVRDDGFDPEDPALRLGGTLYPHIEAFTEALGELGREERTLAADLGRAQFEVYGRSIAPDATFSPRITDGTVQPYAYNGTLAPPFTSFYGLYDRFYTQAHPSDWDLPPRWQTPPPGLDLRTPLNFISTADTYGGNSGSPAVTRDLALVGLNFDRNIEGLSRDYIYLPERGRNIMVDVRAVQAAMDHVYDADRIVQELLTGRLFRTEVEADRARP